jgi:protein-tyrosine phosphatase
MIDLHNHILYDWDDGPPSIEKSLEMARQAVAIGTTIMVATPHRFTNGRESTPEMVRERVNDLNLRLIAEGIELQILPGVEIPIEFGIGTHIKNGRLSTLGNGNFVLIEPPFPDLPDYLLPAIRELLGSGLDAVLAHPERNSAVQKAWNREQDLTFVSACAELGCTIQLTSGSITGRFGTSALSVSRSIAAQRNWNIVIASDSHDAKDRTPGYLAEARDLVSQWIGDPVAADAMVLDLPAAILGL